MRTLNRAGKLGVLASLLSLCLVMSAAGQPAPRTAPSKQTSSPVAKPVLSKEFSDVGNDAFDSIDGLSTVTSKPDSIYEVARLAADRLEEKSWRIATGESEKKAADAIRRYYVEVVESRAKIHLFLMGARDKKYLHSVFKELNVKRNAALLALGRPLPGPAPPSE